MDYDQGSHDDEYPYEDEAAHINGHLNHPQTQLLPPSWNQDHQFAQEGYPCPSLGSDRCPEGSDFSTEFDPLPYPDRGDGDYRSEHPHDDHTNRNHFQVRRCFINQ